MVRQARHQSREVALQILYQMDVSAVILGGSSELVEYLQVSFEHFRVHADLRVFASQLVMGTLKEQEHLDRILEKHLPNWKIGRLNPLDRALLRMSLYEMNYLRETPAPIVLDEAVELAKEFGAEDAPAFVNGILDAIRRES